MSILDLHAAGDGDNRYYTGVGARVTPSEICGLMTRLARQLDLGGYWLRSGLAREGADEAFRMGVGEHCQLFDPKERNYPILKEAYGIAQRHHAWWDDLSPFVKKLMARNVHACLGPDLLSPSAFLLCWTVDGCTSRATRTRSSGGTGHTVSVADEFRIPVYNLNNSKDYKLVLDCVMGDRK